nr:GntR family transcriptional regulator [Chelatococcus sp. YT9]
MANRSQTSLPPHTQIAPVVPLYHRVYTALRQQLIDGAFAPGKPLPGELKLAKDHAVGRVTLRRALQQLESEGLIVRRPGAGTFPAKPRMPQRSRAQLHGWLEPVVSVADGTGVQDFSFDMVQAPVEASEALELTPGAYVLRIRRTRLVDGEPVIFATIYIPEHYAHLFSAETMDKRTTTEVLEASGVPLATIDQSLSARVCDGIVAGCLGLTIGTALIFVRRTLRDIDGHPVEYFESYYRPDRYEYRQRLSRIDDTDTERGGWLAVSATGQG